MSLAEHWMSIAGWAGLTTLGLSAVGAWRLGRSARGPRWLRRVGVGALILVAVGATPVAGYGLWARYRPQPSPVTRTLAPGIEYRRLVLDEPRPMVVHVATVDLSAKPWRALVTPIEDDGTFAARTVSSFADETGAWLAVNTHFFYPGKTESPWEYYPRPGEPVRVLGRSIAGGHFQSRHRWHDRTLYFDERGHASFERLDPAFAAVSGRNLLVADGASTGVQDKAGLAPRLGVGLDEASEQLLIVLVDGRQPGYSEGATLPELAQLLLDAGAHDAIELDGGGSATMVARDDEGVTEVLNSPIHTRLPGRERPVAAHLGLR